MKNIELIIWDFDGVLSDSEKLWVGVWQEMINQHFGVNWDFKTADRHLGGIALKTKVARLAEMGLPVDDTFLEETKCREAEYFKEMTATPGAEKILQELKLPYVLATGGTRIKTESKLAATKLKKYFPDNKIFTAEQVSLGKPAPDLFLFAANQTGTKPQNCLVIEDSIPGLTAALSAGMYTVAFIGGEMNNTLEYKQKVEDLGVKQIFSTMTDLEKFLINIEICLTK